MTLCIMKSETFALGASDKTLGRLNVGGRFSCCGIDSGSQLKWRRLFFSSPIVYLPSLWPLLDPNLVGQLKAMQFINCGDSIERNIVAPCPNIRIDPCPCSKFS